MDAPLEVKNHRSDCCEVIELDGELDIATAPRLAAVLDAMTPNPDHLIIDVSRLKFLDSTGLRLLVRASTLVAGRIWLEGCSRQVLRLLELTGIEDFFCLEEDREIAHGIISEPRAR